MAITLPNLGLKVWNATTDPYNSSQLADNWYRVDEHDHSPGKGRPLATDSLGDGAVTSMKLAAAAVTADKLAADVAGLRKNVMVKNLISGAAGSAATFVPSFAAALTTTTVVAALQAVFYVDPSHYTSAGRTTTFRLTTSTVVGTTAPAVTYTYGLYPVTGTSNTSITLGTVVAGSTVAIATPTAGTTAGQSSAFTLSAGAYAIGVAFSGAEAASSAVTHTIKLQAYQA